MGDTRKRAADKQCTECTECTEYRCTCTARLLTRTRRTINWGMYLCCNSCDGACGRSILIQLLSRCSDARYEDKQPQQARVLQPPVSCLAQPSWLHTTSYLSRLERSTA
jgi:hypothetical protein